MRLVQGGGATRLALVALVLLLAADGGLAKKKKKSKKAKREWAKAKPPQSVERSALPTLWNSKPSLLRNENEPSGNCGSGAPIARIRF